MKLRRLATTVAATSALVLTAAAPALATGGEHDKDRPDAGEQITCEDLGLVELFPKVEGAHEVDNEFVTTTVYRDGTKLDVEAKEGVIIMAVIIKGGKNGTNVYDEEPFKGMHAPWNDNGKKPTISHYTVCGTEDDGDNGDGDNGDGENGKDENGKDENGKDENGDKNGKDVEEPVAVPTEIPAGTGTAGAGSAGTAGLIAMLAAFAAGAAVIVRRRFLTES